jgi:flagellar hook protein FlgE
MLDSIYVGMSGLVAYSRGLRVIANNTANINTPGFKGASIQFGDLFFGGGGYGGYHAGYQSPGQGVTAFGNYLDFRQGELRQSGNSMDLAMDGQGLFILQDANGELAYTRDGEFGFNDEGILVSRATGAKVMAFDAEGALVEVSLSGLRSNPPTATTTVKFQGNLSNDGSNSGSHTLSDVTVRDALGQEHTLLVEFRQVATTTPGEVKWEVKIKEGSTEITASELIFNSAGIDPAHAKIEFDYTATGREPIHLTFDFTGDVTSFSGGTTSTLKVTSTDGYGHGDLMNAIFDENGQLKLSYSNGQSEEGVTLALARFDSPENIRQIGGNLFVPIDESTWVRGTASEGAFGKVASGVVEISNVDLSSEFSDLVIMQRGYQASSQVVSTANEMLQELFALKGR